MAEVWRTRVLALLREGHFVSTACRAAGVARSRFYEVRAGDRAFARKVEEAIADSELALHRRVVRASRSDARFALQLLERRFPSRWSKRDRVKVDANVQASVTVREPPSARIARLRSLLAALESANDTEPDDTEAAS